MPEWQLTANVWARAILEDDFGVKPSDMRWVRGGISDPARPEKIAVNLPPGVQLEDAPEGTTISELLLKGEIDGFIAPRAPARHGAQYRLAVPRPDGGGKGLFQAHRDFSRSCI